ncbi:galactokinase [Ferrimicrobium sp.]|uniref:GHMP family kinase ATP-binding protein n=1 Tax=Ferrimicrobium sp. TaxID=2926050 RepID=UPI0026242C14|nr:galactokinase [Ferrimicrobium sp.]
MIISRAPLRISLGGGGTDLPSFYRNHGPGFLIAAAINKYVYVAIHDNFEPKYLLKYSEIENVAELDQIRHPMIKAAFTHLDIPPGVEVTSIADIPAGTGLGSSGSFAVGLLNAASRYKGRTVESEWLASTAAELEMNVLHEPVGKQDQYMAAFGGLTALEFNRDESVRVEQVRMDLSDRHDLEASLMLFFTGIRRSASDELRMIAHGVSANENAVQENLKEVRSAGYEALKVLESGDIERFGTLLTNQWKLKLTRQPSRVHVEIDANIEIAIKAGAFGGKLIGAGGGGFLLFSASNRRAVRNAMHERGLVEVPIAFDYVGATTVTA